MLIGIPKEILKGEHRVAATPDTVKKLIQNGHEVYVEVGAGEESYFLDEHYREVGALICENVQNLYQKAEIILKVKEPQFNSRLNIHELDLMHAGQIIITFLHPASQYNHEMIKRLTEKGITGITLDGIPRISRAQSMDALSSMSTAAGYKGMLIAASNIPTFMPMIGTAVGMIRPANVLVVGAGVAGLRAIATAKGLGANVFSIDIKPDAIEHAKSLGAKIVETGIPEKIGVSQDGKLALSLDDKWLNIEKEHLREIVKNSDIIFLSALVFGKMAPHLIDEEMLKSMKEGSYIIDVSIDQGGNCIYTKPGEVIEKYGVLIDGTKNIPSLIPKASTDLLAKNILNLFNYLIVDNRLKLDFKDEIIASVVVSHDYKLLHQGTLEAMGLKQWK